MQNARERSAQVVSQAAHKRSLLFNAHGLRDFVAWLPGTEHVDDHSVTDNTGPHVIGTRDAQFFASLLHAGGDKPKEGGALELRSSL